ncbi:hypothetical protein TPHA_0E01480 [Tetrapisispora phaffii CBS 4417]|uniref:isocitrate dehydrogenase (NAD(+)) n=1 Tax=Tetrapisispora phaffii (strain ATCC 24235 / CBS 4417 / NBRC 1672 / NRRL Y-8282 / UCD 70-5) TaxID=1071381 RepID=G8BTL4_TETPH|nr:hypothetical protein TPHA_0E01480 [Tetrapisispora phaffii CBS 4417]CCE63242.1 hypothetical protein TPHA_0E01480 [Tetrapisispora phaffii CBS 4417]
MLKVGVPLSSKYIGTISKLRYFMTAADKISIGNFKGKPNPETGNYTVPFIEGDGVGPEISKSVRTIFKAAKVPIDWVNCDIGPLLINGETTIPQTAVDQINNSLIALKGPLATPVGQGHRSINLTLRKTFGLFANVRPAKSIPNLASTYENVDLIVIRENTEGEYSGIEHEIVPGVVQSIKLITRKASEKVIKYAFEYTRSIGRSNLIVVHKATIQRRGDGLFVQTAQEMADKYPDVNLKLELIDNTVLNCIMNPEKYADSVSVCPNLYGDILSDLNSGLSTGSLGLTPSANIGETVLYEAVHGSAPDIAGQDKANPTALLLSSVMMLNHMGLQKYADMIETAVLTTITSGKEFRTADLGGSATTTSFTKAVIENLN